MTEEILDLTKEKVSLGVRKKLESIHKPGRLIICPALTDIQINGFSGIDFNAEGLSVEDVEHVSKALAAQGVGCYFPALITNSEERINGLLTVIRQATEEIELCRRMILGIHLEGPFISKEDGPRGAHPLEFVTAPKVNLMKSWKEISNGLVKLVTVSPEWENMDEFYEYCYKNNILVSIGHTSANAEQIEQAVRCGAICSTHLGNGCHSFLKRHPNYIWDQLSCDQLYASIIADGHHLPAHVIEVFAKVKNEKLILISDATQFSGKEPGDYTTLIGGKVSLTKERRLYVLDHPEYLAGSAMGLLDMLKYIKKSKVLDLGYAVNCASNHPRNMLKGVCKFHIDDIIIFHESEDDMEFLGRLDEVPGIEGTP